MTVHDKARALAELDRVDLRLMELSVDLRAVPQAHRALAHATAALHRARTLVLAQEVAR